MNFKCVYAEYNDIMRAHLGVNPFWIWHLLAKPLFRKIFGTEGDERKQWIMVKQKQTEPLKV